jgi:ubiquitin C-terminal hydrolase
MINPVDISQNDIKLIQTNDEYVITYNSTDFSIRIFNKRTEYDLTNNKYLFIPIKRFNSDSTKNSRLFEINEYINNNTHKLVGFIVQVGSLRSGHYYCYIKRGKIWYNYNDSSVSEASFDEINDLINQNKQTTSNATPYILLYRRINGNPDISYLVPHNVNPQFDKYLVTIK